MPLCHLVPLCYPSRVLLPPTQMKKRINIAVAALNFLHRILSDTGVVTKTDARKQHTVFQCMEKALQTFREKINKLRMEYRVEEEVPDGRGVMVKRWVIPEAKRLEYDEKILALENERVDVDFDIESLSVLNQAFDGMFARQAALKDKGESDGISNETTMKLIDEAARALESAQDAN